MSTTIPETHEDLLSAPNFVTVVTVMPSGQPQASVLWSSFDGEHIVLNTARGRQKDRNIHANTHVTVLAVDHEDPYRWIEVRGVVDEITEEGALDHINSLSLSYRGYEDYYKNMPQLRGVEQRMIFKIKPTHINTGG
ncbi:MAG: PPOX class F420-dependent oxidoreductase [Anaerolineae bacterium]|nr:PPOX class F420-dependent oxidoreductase [Anaerolineae bacterium]